MVYPYTSTLNPTILIPYPKNIPSTIAKRISSLLSNEDAFNRVAPLYNKSPPSKRIQGGHHYIQEDNWPKKDTPAQKETYGIVLHGSILQSARKRKLIGKTFLKLLDRHFPPRHMLTKILNRNTIKVSYSFMPIHEGFGWSAQQPHNQQQSREPTS